MNKIKKPLARLNKEKKRPIKSEINGCFISMYDKIHYK